MARNWKAYLERQIRPFMGEDVLEVGAGLGGTTRQFCRGSERRWLCLEPDPGLADRLSTSIRKGELPTCCQVVVGTLEQAAEFAPFDTLIYIDVLEHIEDDRGELARAAKQLRPSGKVIVLSPAHQALFTPFDEAIGHFRRYSRRTLKAVGSHEKLELIRLCYLDSVGLVASLGNRLVLKSAMPSARQIALWDHWMVPASRIVDPCLGHSIGKSVLGVWRKRA